MNDLEHQLEEPSPAAGSSLEGRIRWAAGVPRWVKVFVITALGLALLPVVMLLSGGRHGPGRHLSSAGFHASVAYSARAASFFSPDDTSALSWR
jgi:hypothetical protein